MLLSLFFFPSLIIIGFRYLFVFVKELKIEANSIVIVRCPFFKDVASEVDVKDIEAVNVKSGYSTKVSLALKSGKKIRVEALYLEGFEEGWIEPPFSDYMPSEPKSRAAFKIAYNISKKYNIPFETEHIKE